jgi:hypothetical protein
MPDIEEVFRQPESAPKEQRARRQMVDAILTRHAAALSQIGDELDLGALHRNLTAALAQLRDAVGWAAVDEVPVLERRIGALAARTELVEAIRKVLAWSANA